MSYEREAARLLDREGMGSGHPYTPEWKNYISARQCAYAQIAPGITEASQRSEAAWVLRGKVECGEDIGIWVIPGDICWMDFGQTFKNEIGYQHFGLILTLCDHKALVVPMTSNAEAYRKAGDPSYRGVHLMRLGQPKGLNKPSTLFLNDVRFVNTARVLRVRAHIDPESELFRRVKTSVLKICAGMPV